ncbi:hypothetical protein HDV01_001180 [Terramyces sp. JEL0728]|nr:hypothetical protein HDV01_001180 [Terramyces sp. JEL0728]
MANCTQIPSTSVCAPFTGAIDTTVLSKVYGTKIDQSSWESNINQLVSGDRKKEIWSNYFNCPGYNGESIQYSLSFICMTDLYHYSKDCNKQVTPVCSSVCEYYQGALSTLLEDKSKCPIDYKDNSQKTLYERRRSTIFDIGKFCNGAGNSCISGVQKDQISCGLLDNDLYTEYCKDYPTESCCKQKKFSSASGTSDWTSAAGFTLICAISLAVVGAFIFCAVPLLTHLRGKRVSRVHSYTSESDFKVNTDLLHQQETAEKETDKISVSSSRGLVKSISLHELDISYEKVGLLDERIGKRFIVKKKHEPKSLDWVELSVGDIVVFESLDGNIGEAVNQTTTGRGKASLDYLVLEDDN